MVKGIWNFLHKESNGLHQAAYLLGFFALLSQILGLFRDRLLAHNFGARLDLDLYYAAFRLPDFLFVSVASLVSISILIPILVERLEKKEESKKFLDSVFSFFFVAIIVSSGAIFFLSPAILKIIFPGFAGAEYDQLVLLTRILLLSPIFLGFSNLLGSIVQARRRFLLYALSPIVYNFSIILGIFFFVPDLGITGVTLGVVIGAFLHFAILLPFVYSSGLLPALSLKWSKNDLKSVILLSAPRTFALSVNHISLLFLFSFASVLVSGSIAIFNLSFNLQSVPLSIIGVSYSLAAFPTLAKFFVNGEHLKFVDQILSAAKHIIFWSFPVAILFIVLRAQVVRTILGSGEFSWSDTRLTAAALAIFSISIVSQGLNLLFTRGYYAAGNTKKPLILNSISAAFIVVFSFGLIKVFESVDFFRFFIETLFRVEGLPGSVVLMLPLGYSLGTILNSLMLWMLFRSDFGESSKKISEVFFQSFSAAIIMGFVSYLGLQILAPYLDQNTLIGIFLQGFLAGIVGIMAGIVVLLILGNKEILEIWSNFQKRFWGVKVIGSDSEIT